MVLNYRHSTPTPTYSRPTHHHEEHTKTDRQLELRTTHAPYQPRHHLSRNNPRPPPHPGPRTPTLTDTPTIYSNRRSRPKNHTNHTRNQTYRHHPPMATFNPPHHRPCHNDPQIPAHTRQEPRHSNTPPSSIHNPQTTSTYTNARHDNLHTTYR